MPPPKTGVGARLVYLLYIYMYITSGQKRIITGIFLSTAIVAGALVIQGNHNKNIQQNVDDTVPVVVGTAPDRTAIPIADSNGDGVPDWQEALLATTPIAVPTTASSTYTGPDTLTEQFSLEFFERMVRSENSGVFGQSPEALVAASSQALIAEASDELITASAITVSNDTSVAALSRYGESIAAIMITYSEANPVNEVLVLEAAMQSQDEAVLAALDPKIAAYTAFLEETKKVIVPATMTQEHLNLLNSYQAILNDIIAMRGAFTDPMLALLRLKRYQDDMLGLQVSITNLYESLLTQGATWPSNSVVFSIIGIRSE